MEIERAIDMEIERELERELDMEDMEIETGMDDMVEGRPRRETQTSPWTNARPAAEVSRARIPVAAPVRPSAPGRPVSRSEAAGAMVRSRPG
jgi:hypothetical protein